MKKFFAEKKTDLLQTAFSILFVITASILDFNSYHIVARSFYIVAYGVIAYGIIFDAFKDLLVNKKIGEKMLMFIASLGAMLINRFFDGCLILIIYYIGEMFEFIAVSSSKQAIMSLASLSADKARLSDGRETDASSVKIGDEIEVFAGERIPLDGIITDGIGTEDTSALTGESFPVILRPGEEVFAGYMNMNSVIRVKVSRPLEKSAAQRIIRLSEEALTKKSKSQKFIDAFSAIYTPIVILLALFIAVFPPLITGRDYLEWIYKALCILAISCPCAVVISVPLSYFCGIGYASKKGILIKNSIAVDSLSEVRTVAFDKTGTLTKSSLHVSKIEPANGVNKIDLLKYIYIVEQKSNHPAATAVKKEAKKFNIPEESGSNYIETPGKGIECDSKYGHIRAGSPSYIGPVCEKNIYVAVTLNNRYIGGICVGDELKSNSKLTFEALSKLGVKQKIIISGDKKAKVDAVARTLLADVAYSELLPEDKLDAIEDIMKSKIGKVAYCGDGINDTPALSRADVGIAMGAVGSDSAVDCSDVIIMDDDLAKIPFSIKIAKTIKKVIIENIVISLLVKTVFMVLCSFGFLSLIWAVFADVGMLMLAILNSLRAGR